LAALNATTHEHDRAFIKPLDRMAVTSEAAHHQAVDKAQRQRRQPGRESLRAPTSR
jgi:hypothetical protein